jgi:tRNA_anti-like
MSQNGSPPEFFFMKRRLIKNTIFIFVALVVIASIAGYLLWNKPHTNILESETIETSSIDLYKIFITDSTEAKTTYVNKVLNVSGIVKSVSANQEHQQIILLKTSESDASVNCTMEGSGMGIKAGDQILLKGPCVGYIRGETDMGLPGDVFLVRCYRFI